MLEYLKKKYGTKLALTWSDVAFELQLDEAELTAIRSGFKFGDEKHFSFRHFLQVVLDRV